MTLTPSNDFNYIISVLEKPGMKSLCMAKRELEVDIPAEVKKTGHRFFVAEENGEKLGFTSLTDVGHGNAVIHLALKTRGDSTLEMVSQTVRNAISLGFKAIHAIYPYSRRSVNQIALKSGFTPITHYTLDGEDWVHQVKILTA